MTRIRRSGYVFVTWNSDHAPRHVHVYRDNRLVLKWNLDDGYPMQGKATGRLVDVIRKLQTEGLL